MTQTHTVEDLIAYAGQRFYLAGIPFKGGRMSRIIRALPSTINARHLIDTYLDRAHEDRSWAGFELYAHGGYRDPTGAHAARNVDLERNTR
ncbi:hypothetical protein ACO03V_14515 [Microbacterium sp. HMH0099]|uniref:hypothetical protein n=1 Tax=Microbacterium sp. HMH0099 TaxID=3414026 RepID=UPI003BF6935D